MITTLLRSCIRIWRRPARRRQRLSVFAQAHGQTMLLDCQRHQQGWSGVVKIREGRHHELSAFDRSAMATLY